MQAAWEMWRVADAGMAEWIHGEWQVEHRRSEAQEYRNYLKNEENTTLEITHRFEARSVRE